MCGPFEEPDEGISITSLAPKSRRAPHGPNSQAIKLNKHPTRWTTLVTKLHEAESSRREIDLIIVATENPC